MLATADVVVVGAGIAGLCSAWELRQRGFDVVVVEQRFPGYGASGRHPGSIWLQTRRSGLELELSRAGKAKYAELVTAIGNAFDYREAGGLMFFETEEQAEVIQDYVRDRQSAGLDIQMISRSEALNLAPILPDTAIGAAYCADDAQIDSLTFMTAMDAACMRAGVQIFRNTPVLSTLRDGDRVFGVRTVRGAVHSSGVLWASGAWASTLRTEGIDLPVETTRVGQLMMQPVEPHPSPVLHGPRGMYGCGAVEDLAGFETAVFAAPAGDTAELFYDDTIVLNQGGSLYVGHSIDGRGSLNPHISLEGTHAMVGLALERYQRYAHFGIRGLWAGLGCETPDQLPIVDLVDGVYVNLGHSWGVSSAPFAGQVIAEVIAGEPSSFAARLSAKRATLHPVLDQQTRSDAVV
jgi:glycine/D-amino acid oxidase-like deaminating enzyme